MDVVAIGLVVLCALLAGGAGWLAVERGRLKAEAAAARAERDAAVGSAAAGEAAVARAAAQSEALRVEAAALAERVEAGRREHAATVQQIEQRYRERAERDEQRLRELSAQMKAEFDALATKALDASGDRFLKLARESLGEQQKTASAEFERRKVEMQTMLGPVAESLQKTDQKLAALDLARAEHRAALDQQLRSLGEQARGLEGETRKLVQSLKAPQVRGAWGEQTLERVVELAGMVEHCDFAKQVSLRDGQGTVQRPDLVVKLPGGRTIVVDAKVPLHAYIEAVEATADDVRASCLQRHAKQVRQKVDELAGRQYQALFDSTPDFVVLFVPGDQFLSAAWNEDNALLDYAHGKGVLMTTPATLIALLKAVRFGWAQASVAEDARVVLKLGKELHERVSVMVEHFAKVGQRLGQSVEAYNQAIASFESRVLPSARKMEGHNIGSSKAVGDGGEHIAVSPRLPSGSEG